ncbi:MAG: DUF541 domain-containing protein [Wenzhouxiangella sp.]|nr:MAG: DUF541 domain-containing protein [Wenzhouxiangella sp.]
MIRRNLEIKVEQVRAGVDPRNGFRRGFEGCTRHVLADLIIDYDLARKPARSKSSRRSRASTRTGTPEAVPLEGSIRIAVKNDQWIPAAVLAVGLVLASVILGAAIRDFRISDRFVEVKGFAEREVMADLAIWPINFQLAGNSLDEVRAAMDSADESVIAFLKLRGFSDAEISRTPPRISDQWIYASGPQRPDNRYTAERGITLRTERIEATRTALEDAADLVSQGVVLMPGWGQSAQFLFTGLEEIKPEMIAEATADARRAAARFAADSDARVGAIRSARQGFFSINERDSSTPEVKLVRVVTTIEYLLD